MAGMPAINLRIIVVFLRGVFWLGSRFCRWIGSPDDFFVASRDFRIILMGILMTSQELKHAAQVALAGPAIYLSGGACEFSLAVFLSAGYFGFMALASRRRALSTEYAR